MDKISTKKIIDDLSEIKRLPRMPEALFKLNRMLSCPEEIHVDKVAEVVMQDPRLTIGILKLINSARYSTGKTVTSISEAIARLGINDLRVVVLAIGFQEAFQQTPYLDREKFIQYGLLAANVAAELSRLAQMKMSSEAAFMIGLMQDSGIYLLLQYEGLNYAEVVEGQQSRLAGLVNMENKKLGFSHANLGARLLKTWLFPDEVVMGVLGHHAPYLLDASHQLPAYVGFLAEAGAQYVLGSNGVFESEEGHFSSHVPRVLDRFGLSQSDFVKLIESAQEKAASY